MMACNISKNIHGSTKFLGSMIKSIASSGFMTLEFSGSGLFVNTANSENGNAADCSPILKSDSIY
jgi:hypothetical protein